MSRDTSLRGSVLAISLEAAVPLWMAQLAALTPEERIRIATESAQVIASQGDTLQFGSSRRHGHGTQQAERHLARARRGAQCPDPKCWCHHRGEPEYSTGEVFNFLAKGLACAAFQPGGITFAGLHWCACHRECEEAEREAGRASAA